jgi:hypothetical protein
MEVKTKKAIEQEYDLNKKVAQALGYEVIEYYWGCFIVKPGCTTVTIGKDELPGYTYSWIGVGKIVEELLDRGISTTICAPRHVGGKWTMIGEMTAWKEYVEGCDVKKAACGLVLKLREKGFLEKSK